jgi:hypothetical protein
VFDHRFAHLLHRDRIRNVGHVDLRRAAGFPNLLHDGIGVFT